MMNVMNFKSSYILFRFQIFHVLLPISPPIDEVSSSLESMKSTSLTFQ